MLIVSQLVSNEGYTLGFGYLKKKRYYTIVGKV